LYREPIAGIVGCYSFFDVLLSWKDASSFCRSSNFGGSLAAARTQGEHDLLKTMAGSGIRFWIAANSLANDGIWRWEGYGTTVAFNLPWVTLADSNYQMQTGKVILDGRLAPYSWDFQFFNTSRNYYVCRKSG
jgi:hypothetical protein